MSGDVFLTRSLRWPASSSLYNWVLEFLLREADQRGSVDALREIREHQFGVIALEDFPVEDRDELLSLLATRLVSDAGERLPPDLTGRGETLTTLEELADMAVVTLREHRGQELVSGWVSVDQDLHWQASSWFIGWVARFVRDNLPDGHCLLGTIASLQDQDPAVLDLTRMDSESRRALLIRFRDDLVPDARRRLPSYKVGLPRYLAKLQQLADMAAAATTP